MPTSSLSLSLPISLAGVGAIYYGISMLSLANGNMTTALAVAANIDFLPAIAAMSLTAAPAIILPLTLYGLYRIRKYQTDQVDYHIIVVLSVMASLVALFYSSMIVLFVVILLLVAHLIHLLSHKKSWKRKFERGRFDPELAQILMVSILMTSVIWGPSWLVRETAVIAEKEHLISIVKETDELIYYLDRKTDRVVYARPSDLSERAFCGSSDVTTLNAFINILTDGPTYPGCPSTKNL